VRRNIRRDQPVIVSDRRMPGADVLHAAKRIVMLSRAP